MSDWEARNGQELARLQRTLREVEDASASLEQATEEAVSKDRLVAATVNASGELVELKFNTQSYRGMAPTELASAIKDVINRARGQMADRVETLYQPFAPEGIAMDDLMKGTFNLRDLFYSLDAEPPPR
ncbi:YbaB/EbfC family nucleoid-associated protein [Nocardiopsis deserti]|uniref:YbaB/EbfC family nucleoid-associated protein n=1 Tax=Nocardiopsis deserti TaxID=2605988 RepID=UPI001238B206|nr:YbaB/EbfC family nucleoid-associated protein [Nocardiopsis deserti]